MSRTTKYTTHRKGRVIQMLGRLARRRPLSRFAAAGRVGMAAAVFGVCLAGSGIALAATTGGGLVWSGDLSTNNLSQYYIQSCPGPAPAQGITLVNSPVHPGWQHSMKFTVTDQSVHANCPILGSPTHPNAVASTARMFTPGSNYYIGFSTLFPAGFPQVCTPWVIGCYMQVAEVYGQPFGGASPVSIMAIQGKLVMGTSHNGIVWHGPNYTYGTWQDLVLHVNFSTSPSIGYVEIWLNGQLQKFDNGSTRYYEATLQPGINWDGVHPNYMAIDQYRDNVPAYGTTILYHTGVKIGTSYASAAP
jgi:hypothetical protein